jgi:hypothetical protein
VLTGFLIFYFYFFLSFFVFFLFFFIFLFHSLPLFLSLSLCVSFYSILFFSFPLLGSLTSSDVISAFYSSSFLPPPLTSPSSYPPFPPLHSPQSLSSPYSLLHIDTSNSHGKSSQMSVKCSSLGRDVCSNVSCRSGVFLSTQTATTC